MQDLHTLETHELIDLLSYMTAQLTTSLIERNKGVIQQFEYDISMIQSEINSRNAANTSISDPNLEITQGS